MTPEIIQNGCVETEGALEMGAQAVFLSHMSREGWVHAHAHNCNLSLQSDGIPS